MSWPAVPPRKYGPTTGQRVKERCESGRIGFTANELTWVTGSEGSNPSLSAERYGPFDTGGLVTRLGPEVPLVRNP